MKSSNENKTEGYLAEIDQLKQNLQMAISLLKLSALALSDDINSDNNVKRLNDQFIERINDFITELQTSKIL